MRKIISCLLFLIISSLVLLFGYDFGIDDYIDIMLGVRKDAENKLRYDSQCWAT